MKVCDKNQQNIDSAVQQKVASLWMKSSAEEMLSTMNEAYPSCLRYRAAFILHSLRGCGSLEGPWKKIEIISSRCRKAFMFPATVRTGTDSRTLFSVMVDPLCAYRVQVTENERNQALASAEEASSGKVCCPPSSGFKPGLLRLPQPCSMKGCWEVLSLQTGGDVRAVLSESRQQF